MDKDFPRLLDSLYEGLTRFEHFPEFLEELCRAVDSQSCYIEAFGPSPAGDIAPQESRLRYASPDIEEHIERYFQDGVGRNPNFLLIASGMEPGKVLYANDLMHFFELAPTESYQLWLKLNETMEIAGICLDFDGQGATIAFFNWSKQTGFAPEARMLLELFAPHLVRFYRVWESLGEAEFQRQAAWHVLDQYNHGVILINTQRQITFINRSAKAIFDECDGVLFRQGLPTIVDCESNNKLMEIFDRLTQSGFEVNSSVALPRITVPRSSGRKPLQLLIAPMGRKAAGFSRNSPAVALYLLDPEHTLHLKIEQVIDVYELTETEARLALLIAQGVSLSECAKILGHQTATSRNLLKRVYTKTGTHRQHELTAELLRLGVPVLTGQMK